MINPQGQPYEIHVVDQFGGDAIVDAARRALEQTVYEPARVGGRPVDGSSRLRISFKLEGLGDGARRRFSSRYRQFMAKLSEASQTEAASALRDLERDILRHYEFAYLNLARYSYAAQYGSPLEQMKYLKSALGETLSNPELESYLEFGAAREARRELLQLQLRNSYFGKALDTFELMRLRGDDEGVGLFRDAIAEVTEFRANNVAYPVAARIEDNGSWLIVLFKTSFHLSDLTGTVAEMKLRCERSYVFFEFDPELQYNVSDTVGGCTLEVIGDPGTTFTLVQAR